MRHSASMSYTFDCYIQDIRMALGDIGDDFCILEKIGVYDLNVLQFLWLRSIYLVLCEYFGQYGCIIIKRNVVLIAEGDTYMVFCEYFGEHYGEVVMGTVASQITSLTIVYSTVYSGADQRKHQSSASLAFVRGIHRGPVNSPHKWPVTRENVFIWWRHHEMSVSWYHAP